MPIANSEINTLQYILDPMNLTDTEIVLTQAIINNIKNNKLLLSNLNSDSQDKLNELISAIDSLNSSNSTDVAKLQDDIANIMQIETGNDSFLGAFGKLYTAINKRDETTSFELVIPSSPNGKVAVDLTQFGFSTVDEFEAFCQVITTADGHSVDVSFKKDSPQAGTLTLRDSSFLSDSSIAESFYDAATKGTVTVVIIIGRTARPLVSTININPEV